jgi:DNA-binding NarL/FixJ family response regulator
LRILIDEQAPIIREGLRAVLDGQPDIEIFTSGAPDVDSHVVICGDPTPELSAATVVERARQGHGPAGILIVSPNDDVVRIRELLAAGVSGYAREQIPVHELVRAVWVIAGGGVYVDPALAHLFTRDAPALSGREATVVRLTAWGLNTREIAARLGVGDKTAETYRTRAMTKLGVKDRSGLVRYALDRGWLRK